MPIKIPSSKKSKLKVKNTIFAAIIGAMGVIVASIISLGPPKDLGFAAASNTTNNNYGVIENIGGNKYEVNMNDSTETSDVHDLLIRAQTYIDLGKTEEAIVAYQDEQLRNNITALNNLGYIYSNLKATEENTNLNIAASYYDKAISLGSEEALENKIAFCIKNDFGLDEILYLIRDGCEKGNKNISTFFMSAIENNDQSNKENRKIIIAAKSYFKNHDIGEKGQKTNQNYLDLIKLMCDIEDNETALIFIGGVVEERIFVGTETVRDNNTDCIRTIDKYVTKVFAFRYNEILKESLIRV